MRTSFMSGPRARGRVLLAAVLLAAAAGGLVACGDDDEGTTRTAAVKGLGGSSADTEQVKGFFEALRGFSSRDIAFRKAVQAGDVVEARKVVDGMDAQLDKAEPVVAAIDNAEVRANTTRYTRSLRAVATVYDRFVANAEGTGPQGDAADRQIAADITKATTAAAQQDTLLIKQITAALPAGERADFTKAMKEYQSNLNRQAGTTGTTTTP